MPDTAGGPPRRDAAETTDQAATQEYIEHRELLFSVVYNILGTVADAEDVLQETWQAWSARCAEADAEQIASPRAYLVRSAVNAALARQHSISRRREDYVGPWLPDPLVTGELADDGSEIVVRAHSVSMALLVVLESLTPLERAVFVLHEVFGYEHAEVARILSRNPAAIRQLAHRAREHVQARRPLYSPDSSLHQRVTERFVAAVAGGDLNALMQLLAPDVTVWTDGGGKARATRLPVHGRDRATRLIAGAALRWPIPDLEICYKQVNGEPAAMLLSGGNPHLLVMLDLAPGGEQAQGVYVITNPDKLSRLLSGWPR